MTLGSDSRIDATIKYAIAYFIVASRGTGCRGFPRGRLSPKCELTNTDLVIMTRLKASLISVCLVAGVAAPLALLQRAQTRLSAKNESLRRQAGEISQLKAENTRLSNLVTEAGSPLPNDSMHELLKLRAEVANLRQQLAETSRSESALKRQAEEQRRAAGNKAEQEAILGRTNIGRMNYAYRWGHAFQKYAAEHGGQLPATFDEAAPYLPQDLEAKILSESNPFEIVYHGALSALVDPSWTIVLRETKARVTPDGGWVRAYGFADGHAEVHGTPDGNFAPWEHDHAPTP